MPGGPWRDGRPATVAPPLARLTKPAYGLERPAWRTPEAATVLLMLLACVVVLAGAWRGWW